MAMRWYVVHSKSRNEDLLCKQLCLRNIEVYYPRIRLQPVNSRARKVKPYFPGYLFVHVDLSTVGTSTLQWMPGAIGLVCFGGEPAYVAEEFLYAIRERIDQINRAGGEGLQHLKPAQEIKIHSGPFAGYRGMFAAYLSDRERAVVLLSYIRDQQIRVQLPVEQFGGV
jgi:transcriptional antiterminator RfaH